MSDKILPFLLMKQKLDVPGSLDERQAKFEKKIKGLISARIKILHIEFECNYCKAVFVLVKII
jgi:hypothetical protein